MAKLQHLPTDPYARPRPEPNVAFTVVISSGVTSSGLTLTPTEFEQVLSGGTAVLNTVDSGGQVTVMSGGFTKSDTVLSGGVEILSAGAAVSSVIVSAGGLISGPGVADDATIFGFAAGLSVGPYFSDYFPADVVESGGTASALSVLSGGDLYVLASGFAEVTTVSYGGLLSVGLGGLASGSVVGSGGAIDVYGEADTTALSKGAYAYVAGSSVDSSGSISAVTGSMSSVKLAGGAELVVGSGGVASNVLADSGAVLDVDSGGLISTTTLNGATMTLDVGGEVENLVLSGGASATLHATTAAIGVKVISGTLSVEGQRATAEEVSLAAGGTIVDDGLVANIPLSGYPSTAVLAGTITGGGLLAQLSGGTLELSGTTSNFKGELIVGGGKIELADAGAVAHASLDFDNIDMSSYNLYGTFQIDAADQPVKGGGFSAPIIDFSSTYDRIDLAGLAFTSGATAKVSGDTLTLVDGSYTATFTLSRTKATKYGVKSDGAGGTLIEAGGSSMPLVEAAAAFQPTAGGMTLSAAEMRSAGLALAVGVSEPTARHALG